MAIRDLILGGSKEEREILSQLRHLESDKTPLRLEIEAASVRFYSVLSLKRGMVIIAKPPGLREGIIKGGFVRFRLPEEQARELRLEVAVPHFNLISGSYVFLCKIPKKFAESSARSTERYNTSRFNNLFLSVGDLKGRYRIIDISKGGCKVFLEDPKLAGLFKMGVELTPASINVGGKVKIDLLSVVARSHHQTQMGFQLIVDPDGPSGKYLVHFLKSLETAENSRMQGEAR